MARMLIDSHGRAIPETSLTADLAARMDWKPGEEVDNRPKNAFEAAIDKATGYEPGDENSVVSDAAQDGQGEGGGAEAAETKPGADETKQAEVKENAAPVKEKHDWVEEAYECFVKNAVDLEPTDPVGAIKAYFKKNATDELKAKAKAEGKTADSCWKFIEAVARKALGSRSGHIDPVAVYAIAMHYFQDVPVDWDVKKEKVKAKSKKVGSVKSIKTSVARSSGKKKTEKIEELERKIAQPGSAKHAQELKAKLKAEKEKLKEKEKKQKAKKRGGEQGFFFDLMETETVGPENGNGGAEAAQGGKEADDAE